ncbi:hypothetical protein ACQPZG_20330 [Streptomyces sp. CA-294286]|uniref:hypothetical protein n=1 Tax=Streptomyces sp. CA-294286 TaxID=3240070 RepID=UPI003D8CC978
MDIYGLGLVLSELLQAEPPLVHGDVHSENIVFPEDIFVVQNGNTRVLYQVKFSVKDLNATARIGRYADLVEAAARRELGRRALERVVEHLPKASRPSASRSESDWPQPRRPHSAFTCRQSPTDGSTWVLPGISVEMSSSAVSHLAGLTDEQLRAVAVYAAKFRDVLVQLVQDLLEPRAYEYVDHFPPTSTSPCGVIRFAAPVMPRAPGSQKSSDVSVRLPVLATA